MFIGFQKTRKKAWWFLFIIVGTFLATLLVDPKVGKILLFRALFKCLSPSLTIASVIAYQNPFVSMIEHLEDANEARSRFAKNNCRYEF